MTNEQIPPQPRPEIRSQRRYTWLALGLLIVVLVCGVYFRFVGFDWDESNHLHPDERFLTMVSSAIQIPDNLSEYFNSQTSRLNPYNSNFGLFVYGDLPIFITRYSAHWLDELCKANEQFCFRTNSGPMILSGYDGVHLLGRALSGLLDLFTLILMFLIGKRLYGIKTGLLAAALGAAVVLQIQQSHFYTADIFASFFVAACLFFVIRLGDTFSWVDTIGAGVSGGLAIASRINVAPVLGILAVAVFIPVLSRWRDPQRKATLEGALARLVAAGLIAIITFRFFMPYAFDGLLSFDPRWQSNMDWARRINSGEDPGGPPGVQWTSRAPLIFPWVNIVFWGLGVPLGLAAWLSWAWAGWQTFVANYLKDRHGHFMDWISRVAQSRHLLIWLWVSGYFVWMGSTWVKSIRYQLPIYPFLSILAAAGLVAFLDRAARARRSTMWRAISIAAVAFVLVGTYAWAWAFTDIYRNPTTRVAASRWIYENVPTAVTLNLNENGVMKPLHLPFPNTTLLGMDNQPIAVPFEVGQNSSVVESVRFNRLIDQVADADPETVRITIGASPDGARSLTSADLTAHLETGGARGQSYDLPLNNPITLMPGETYYAILTPVSGAPIQAESSTLANEHWDDPIPLRLNGRDGFSQYHGVEMKNYDVDTPEKLAGLIDSLDQTDYVMMTSNRLYGSIPRMPMHYPLTSEYYRLMLAGQLGFKQIASFEAYPTLGPFTFPDQETTQALSLWPDPTRCPQSNVPQCQGLINVPMPPAEEAFSVYDHPRVLIFQKTPDFNLDEVRARLGGVDLRDSLTDLTPKAQTDAPTGLMLSEATWQAQQEAGTWSELFDRDGLLNSSPLLGGIAWYVTILLIGWFAFPIVFSALPGLKDRGYGVSRMAGLLTAVFVVWFAASLKVVPFTRATILASVLLLALVGGSAAWRQRVQLRLFVRENRRTLLSEEALFGAAFLFFLVVRFGNPDLWHPVMGGEKPMDFAYLNAVIKSQYFPPYDPWFAGGQVTYYYFGFVLVAFLVKLLGIMPAIAYNFAIPTLFALTAVGAFCAGYNLVQALTRWVRGRYWLKNPLVIGLIAAVFAVFMGNLGEAQLLQEQIAALDPATFSTTIEPLKRTVETAQGLSKMIVEGASLNLRAEWWYFTPTREIPASPTEAGPISEFPYFTFLYADLHAHMIAMPLTLLVLVFAISWISRPPLWSWGGAASIALGGLAAGALRPTNTWDYPTYLLIGSAALLFGTWATESLQRTSTWVRLGVRVAAFVLIGMAAFLPFTRQYATAYSSIEEWKGSLTPWWAYLNIHLLFLFPIVTLIVWEIRRWGWRWWRAMWKSVLRKWRWAVVLIGLVLVAAILWLYRVNREIPLADGSGLIQTQRDVILIAAPIMLLCALLAIRPRLPAAYRFWYFLVFLAIGLTMAVEIIVLKGDISRMNTTFKFYLQVWILLGISAAVALGWLADRLERWRGWGSWLWKGFMGLLVFASFLYVPLATRGKMLDRWTASQPPGLNGADYMLSAEYGEAGPFNAQPFQLQWDHAAIQWLQDNVQGSPVIAEGSSPLYHWGSRISINTGLPTIVGWDWHQRQQRSIMPEWIVLSRMQDVALLYQTIDQDAARKILDRYGVKYIIVGDLERSYYAPEGLEKFELMAQNGLLRVPYQNEGTKIFEVIR
jgi:YYY domain-containing protein